MPLDLHSPLVEWQLSWTKVMEELRNGSCQKVQQTRNEWPEHATVTGRRMRVQKWKRSNWRKIHATSKDVDLRSKMIRRGQETKAGEYTQEWFCFLWIYLTVPEAKNTWLPTLSAKAPCCGRAGLWELPLLQAGYTTHLLLPAAQPRPKCL